MGNINAINNSNSEISLSGILSIIWKEKLLVLFLTSIFSICSIIYALSLPNIYMSSSILSINDSQNNSSGLSRISGQYGDLASIAGIDLPSGGSNDKASLAIEIVLSRELVKNLLTKDNILPVLMATKSYDSVNKKIKYDNEIYDDKRGIWVRKPIEGYQVIPSYLEAHKEYLKIVDIVKDKKTNFITIRVRHQSPYFSEYLLSSIINELNEKVRLADLEEASSSLSYLKSLQEETNIQGIKTSISSLIEGKIQSQMLASINQDYMLRPIDPPYIPEMRFSPSRSMIVIFISFLGGFLSILIVLIRNFA